MTLRELNNKYTSNNVRIGRTIDNCLSVELDSSTIVLSYENKLDIAVYDIVELTNEANNKEYWLIADMQEQYVTFTAPYKFEYTLSLMSLTKYLETIFLPNLTITNIGQNRSIYYYINETINHYFKSDYNITPYISDRLRAATTSVIIKEKTLFEPTLRECLDAFLSQIGSIITLNIIYDENNHYYLFKFDYMNLSLYSGSMPTTYIKEIHTLQDSDGYVSQILHTSDDIVADQTITEYLQETTTEPVFNTDNASLVLSHKPYDFQKLYALDINCQIDFFKKNSNYEWELVGSSTDYYSGFSWNLDITDFIVTADEYETLSFPSKSNYLVTDTNGDIGSSYDAKIFYSTTTKKYITNTLRWERQSKKIENLNYYKTFKNAWVDYDSKESVLNAIRRKALEKYYSQATSSQIPTGFESLTDLNDKNSSNNDKCIRVTIVGYDYETQLFKVEYQPYFSPKIIEISDKEHLVTSVDTDTNAKTSILEQLDLSKEKLKMAGLQPKVFTALINTGGNTSTYFDTYKIGQTWYDENSLKHVITKLEKQINLDNITLKGVLTPNYTNTIIDTSLNREKRYFAYANSDTVLRKENTTKTWRIFLSNSASASDVMCPADYVHAKFTFADETQTDYLLPCTRVYNNRMITFEIATLDNVAVAVTKENTAQSGIGGLASKILKYVDDNGECVGIDFLLGLLDDTKTVDYIDGIAGKVPRHWAADIDVSTCKGNQTIDGEIVEVSLVPTLFYNTVGTNYITQHFTKDNREQLNITIQFQIDIVNTGSATMNFNVARYFEALLNFKTAVSLGHTSEHITRKWYWQIESIGGLIDEDALFTTDFWTLYQANGGTSQYGALRIFYINATTSSPQLVIQISNYSGGYINSSIIYDE